MTKHTTIMSVNGKPLFQGSGSARDVVKSAFKSGVSLRDADLRGANLRGLSYAVGGVDLRGADLRWADLREVTLVEPSFRRADLREADLRGAILQTADLHNARLDGACLRSTYLGCSYLTYATLSGACLKNANLPSPTAMLLAEWGNVSEQLCADLMRFDASCHPDQGAFEWWATGNGGCPYLLAKVERAANFRQQRARWQQGKKCRPYDLMTRLLAEVCPEWSDERVAIFEKYLKDRRVAFGTETTQ